MQKVQIYAHLSEKDRLVERLQDVGVFHVVNFQENCAQTDLVSPLGDQEMPVRQLEDTIASVQFASDYLAEFEQPKGMLSKLSGTKIVLSPGEYERITLQSDYQQVVEKTENLNAQKVHLIAEHNRLLSLQRQLAPWTPLDIPLEQIRPTGSADLFLGSISVGKFSPLEDELSEITDQFELIRINQDERQDYLLLFCSEEFSPQAKESLAQFDFSELSTAELKGTPQQVLRELGTRLRNNLGTQQRIIEESKDLATFRAQLLVLIDHYSNLLQQRLIQTNFARTARTFVTEGWIRKREFPAFKESIETGFEAVRMLPAEPLPGEEPPVLLENPKVVEPFQMITDLYGTPRYFDVDPSFPLAPFFVIALGMCITDAGYGVVLALLSFLALRLFRLSQGTKRLVRVCLWGGLSTIVIGILTGGYFGINFSSLPPVFQSVKALRGRFMLFDPLKSPLIFLEIALAFGFIQICVGLLIGFYRNLREGMFWDGILDQITWLAILNGVVIFALGKAGILSPGAGTFGKWTTLLSMAIVVLFAGRANKGIVARLGVGLFSLYGITGYLGDVLSYSRLLALGMATSVIALVVNTIASMASHIPVVGVVAMLLVLIGGHLFNIAINLLSGFIHSMRLQFVEFFSKFFEAGGTQFKPFRKQYQFLLVAEKE
jgi:V/A-type H+-transporting ATPase subunit I